MQIIEDRRALHRIPELDHDLPRTIAYVQESLCTHKCHIFSPIPSAVCAFFDFGKDSAIAFRADMDALPVQEKTGLSFSSETEGRMHACGHDGHTAILLELARRLNEKQELAHNVLLIFQPAEEASGGAQPICDTGILENYNVQAIFGLHLWPGMQAGQIYSRKGALMAMSSELSVDVYGKAAHISKPAEGLDALAAAVEFYCRVRQAEQELPEDVFRLLNFGFMESGTVRNVISSHTRLLGTLRAFEDSVFYELKSRVEQIAAQVENATGCRITTHFATAYPPVCNPDALFDRISKIVPVEEVPTPSTAAEDFSCYQKCVPGLFFFLGLGDTPALHADTFDFDESLLVKGADLFTKIAEEF